MKPKEYQLILQTSYNALWQSKSLIAVVLKIRLRNIHI